MSTPPASCDLLVYGATPGGIACAVRAARCGLSVVLVTHLPAVGGLLTSGLGVWDTQYEGARAPLYDELRQRIMDDYRETHGADSIAYRNCLPGPSGHTNGTFESKVARRQCEALLAAEPNITVLLERDPITAECADRRAQAVHFRRRSDGGEERIACRHLADCSYEADLLPLLGVAYRVGREPRAEFDEPHAGRIFLRCRWNGSAPDARQAWLAQRHGRLGLRPHPGWNEAVPDARSGAGDHHIQAANWRLNLTDDPANRLPIPAPAHYDADYARGLDKPNLGMPRTPSGQLRVNRPQLPGQDHPYPDGDWSTRQQVMDRLWDAFLQSIHFLRTDPSVPADERAQWQRLGLPADEFAENGGKPFEPYMRETRRLDGRYVLTEHDFAIEPERLRAPVHADAIAVTEWYIDIHACTTETRDGSLCEGKVMLHQETFPGQVPLRAILPRELDNVVVPVCVSCSHVAWSTIRLEPTWMPIGEAAGAAVALAHEHGGMVAAVDVDELQRRLAAARHLLTFTADCDLAAEPEWIPALQRLGTRGCFPDYEVRPHDPLDRETARCWIEALAAGVPDDASAQALQQRLAQVPTDVPAISVEDFAECCQQAFGREPDLPGMHVITRGAACLVLDALSSATVARVADGD